MKKPGIPLKLFAAKHWGTWFGLLLLRVFSILPYSWMKKTSSVLGYLFFNLAKTRKRIIETNIELCFPEKTVAERKKLSRDAFISTIMAVFELSISWWGTKNKLSQLHQVEGMQHLQQALKKGKGVILLSSHFTTMEIAGACLCQHLDNLVLTYKRSKNELLEYFIQTQRLEKSAGLIKHKNLREILRSIKQGNVVWFAPDQDFGEKDSIFAPFMGVMTSTLLSTQRIAKLTGAPVVPFYAARNADDTGYTIRLSPELENFPGNDPLQDATTINQAIENQIKQSPEQYLWAHRRFKTRPDDEKDFYRKTIRIWRYQLLLFVLYIPLAVYTLWQSFRLSDYRYFLQRLGFSYNNKLKNKTGLKGRSIWFHAASVGEVNAIIPLILKIQKEQPETHITISSNTISSASVIEKNLPENIQHYYFPLDYAYAIKNITRAIQADVVVIVETEFWPNLYRILAKRNIPFIIINGRISEKTLFVKKWLAHIYADILPLVTRVFARSEEDKIRFTRVGMPLHKIKVLGNIKFSTADNLTVTPIDLGRNYVLAASTREEEEKLIVDAWLKSDHNNRLLVIVPRHPQRLDEILKQLKPLKLEIAIRSKNNAVTESTNIYIADTIGELKAFIAGSEFVLMGGSFVHKGGHNILEVAQLGKAVIFGLDMRSFEIEAELFLKHQAGVQCSLQQLPDVFNTFFTATNKYEHNSKNLIKANQNIINNYYQNIVNILK